jgi:cytochrome c biogenesis protein CcmG, thiol:disulfide interchange protein DsbE
VQAGPRKARGPPVRCCRSSCLASGGRAESGGTVGVLLLQHTERRIGSAILARVGRLALIFACAALALVACGSEEQPQSKPAQASELAGAPAPLAAVHEQSNELLDGGAKSFERRIRGLRGYPVVVNKWASWCGPCRYEFPFFQRQAGKRAKSVAFLGVNSDDNDGNAKKFLGDFPVPFPSYKDPTLEVAAVFNGVQAFPTTAFYDAKGELAYVHQGGYTTEAKLAADIERYAR